MSDHFNPYPLLKTAAAGDVEAMRLMARAGGEQASRYRDECAIIEALVFARLAYARSGDAGDAGLILGLTGLACELVGPGELRENWEAEGLALMSLLGEAGWDMADEAVDSAMSECSAETVADAKAIRALMMEKN